MAEINISEHLIKDYWLRRITPDSGLKASHSMSDVRYRQLFNIGAGTQYQELTQEDLMNEIYPSAHGIMSDTLSTRPVYRPTGEKNEQGQEKWEIDHFDDVEQVALGIQHTLAFKKASYFAAKGFWISNEQRGDEKFKRFMSWKDYAGLMTAYLNVVQSCFTTGDGAIYIYANGSEIEWKVFSRNNGDILYPDEDENRNPELYREYIYKGKRAVDRFTTEYRETWVQDNTNDRVANTNQQPNGLQKMLDIAKKDNRELSSDGWRLIDRKPNQSGNDRLQVVYYRISDIPSGVVQSCIETLERALSYVSDEVKATAFPMLFMKSGGVKSLPALDAHGKVIVATGDAETVKNSDAKYLTKQDMSNIATINIKELWNNIVHSTLSVFVEPEILKQGSDSSTTIRILFHPEEMWCQNMWSQFYKSNRQLIEIFKRLVGIVEGDPIGYSQLRLSIGLDVWLPQNENEIVDRATKLVYAGLLSQENGANEVGLDYLGDMEKVRKESEDKLFRENYIPTMAKMQAEKEYGVPVSEEVVVGEKSGSVNPYTPKIDNNASNRDIAAGK